MLNKNSNDCVFCRIANKSEKSFVVLEDDLFMAFLDKRPLFLGHSLLIPKAHIETFYDLSEEIISLYFTRLQQLGNAIQKGLECDGTLIANNNVVSQSVPHVHFHVIPRNFKDGLKGFFWPRQQYESEEHIQDVIAKIKKYL